MDSKTAICAQNITKHFKTQKKQTYEKGIFTALDDITLSIAKGECVVIGGANGSGKTVLMLILAGLLPPSKGKVWGSKDVGLVFQDADTQILGETPLEDVCVGLENKKTKKNEREAKAKELLKIVGLEEKNDFPARSLSGGEKRRLATAGILAMNKDIIIFDEPFANLDFNGVRQTIELLQNLKNEKRTILILTHELEKCLALATRFIVLYKGRMVFDGNPQEGLNEPLESWGIRNPIQSYKNLQDLIWK